MNTPDSDDMTFLEMMEAVLKGFFGTDEKMRHPRSREEVQSKILEAHESIDHMRESTGKLARLQPAKNLDEALRQLTGD